MKKLLLLIFGIISITAIRAQDYRLVLPKDSFATNSLTVNFSWSKVDSATDYELQVATDNLFNSGSIVYNPFQSPATTGQYTFASHGQTYFWRVRAWQGANAMPWSYYRSFSLFTPTQINGLAMWFDAAQNVVASGGAVSQWTDLSTSPVVATQSNASQKPTLVSNVAQLCGKPVIYFTGNGGISTAQNLAFPVVNVTDFTSLMVREYVNLSAPIQYVVGGLTQGLFAEADFYSAGFGSFITTATDHMYASVASASLPGYGIYTTQNSHVFRNGVEALHGPPPAGGDISVASLALQTIGCRTNGGFPHSYKGGIAEMLLYNSQLSNEDRQLAEKYLRYKFAPPVNLGPDTILNKFCVSVNLNSGSCYSTYLWSTGATTASINVTALGTYWVRVTDAFGYVSSDTIRVRPLIKFNQLPSNAFLCSGDSLTWNTGYPTAGYQFTWSNGANTPAVVIHTPGTYSVAIKDAFNCTFNSAPVNVVVDPFPDYTLGNDTSFCSGNRLNFDYSAHPLNSILWSTGDTVTEPIIYSPGNYSVVAVNSNGCVAEDTIHVGISGYAPTVNFGNPVLCATDSVQLIDSTLPPSGNSIVWWRWDFGNNDTTTEQNPVHVFSMNGTQTVSLTAVTDSGCVNSITKTLNVYLKPTADFQSKVACAMAETQFLDLSNAAMPAILTKWKWYFANTDSSILKNPKYAFAAPGKFPVVLKVTTNEGCSSYAHDSIEVFAPLLAGLTAQNVCYGDSVTFTDATPSLSVVSWLWNAGDNYFTTKKTFKHKYAAPGNYNVTLQVQNAIGCIDSTSQTITIYKQPMAAFTGSVSCEDQNYTPADQSVLFETNNTWKWNIAGVGFNGQTPQYYFADTGYYPVQLKVTSQSGCKDSVTHTVYVAPVPKAQFSFLPQYGDAPLTATFTNQSLNANSYLWYFGDGSNDLTANPSHVYLSNDTFQITLYATNNYGCTDSTHKSIVVVVTDLDIAIDGIITNVSPQSDGTALVSVSAIVSNVGTRLITDAKLYATIGSGGVISEDWHGLLHAGQGMNYTFTANFVVAAEKANSYVCVEAKSVNNGEQELSVENNRECVSVNGALQIIGPAPNPARSNATLGLILPKPGTVTVDMVDLLGRVAVPQQVLNLPSGRADYAIPVNTLRAGEYFIRIQYNDDKLLKKIVVH